MRAFLATLAALTVMAASPPAAQAVEPGTVPPGFSAGADTPPPPGAGNGLKPFYRAYDKLRLSVDASGAINAASTVQVEKPASNATVAKAFLMASSYGRLGLGTGAVSLDGTDISWMASDVAAAFGFPTYFNMALADVTGVVKNKINAASPGLINFRVTENFNENANQGIDGVILAVVFNTPSDTKKRSIVLLFGGLPASGQAFDVTLAKPIDPAKGPSRADMGVGISFSYQLGGADQSTRIEVNGQRLTSSAGGQDDGDLTSETNGAIITVGGVGDSNKNPKKPNAAPTKPSSDDELYSLLPYLTKTTKSIKVTASNTTDDNNLFFAWLDLSGDGDVTDLTADTDGDGLLDVWEKNGYDANGDGIIDVNLPALGADWRKKDIFIAYAWMRPGPGESKSHEPSAKVLQNVVDAFARAPVPNPDGTNGINLHFRNLGSVAHDEDLNPVWTDFDRLMNPLLTAAERTIYRRMLNGHAYENGGSSGIARGIPDSDFTETLGRFPSNPGTELERSGTIMHELGHTLGLKHGGVDHTNFKPNHLSVMSYLNQFPWLVKDNKPFLDYDRFDLQPLNENNLNERAGLDAVGGDAPLKNYGVRWFSNGTLLTKRSRADVDVQWFDDGQLGQVFSDINNDGGLSTLQARFVEWDNIIYDGGSIGAPGIPGSPEAARSRHKSLITSPDDLKELTYEDVLRMQKNAREVE